MTSKHFLVQVEAQKMGYQTLLEVDTEEELFRRPFTEQELLHLPRLVPEDSRFACCKGGGNIHIRRLHIYQIFGSPVSCTHLQATYLTQLFPPLAMWEGRNYKRAYFGRLREYAEKGEGVHQLKEFFGLPM